MWKNIINPSFPTYVLEIDRKILYYLDVANLNMVYLVNKYFQNILEDKLLWENKMKDFLRLLHLWNFNIDNLFQFYPKIGKQLYLTTLKTQNVNKLLIHAATYGDLPKFIFITNILNIDNIIDACIRKTDKYKRLNMLNYLLDNYKLKEDNNICLRIAIKHNRLDIAKKIIDIKNVDLTAAVTIAIKHDNIQAVKLILSDNNSISIEDVHITGDYKDYAQFIINYIFYVRKIDINKSLQLAVKYNRCSIVKILLEEKMFISDIVDIIKFTIKLGHTEILKTIVGHLINQESVLSRIKKLSIKFNHINIMYNIPSYSSDVYKLKDVISYAIQLHNIDIVNYLLELKLDINSDDLLILALKNATKTKDLSIVKILNDYKPIKPSYSMHYTTETELRIIKLAKHFNLSYKMGRIVFEEPAFMGFPGWLNIKVLKNT